MVSNNKKCEVPISTQFIYIASVARRNPLVTCSFVSSKFIVILIYIKIELRLLKVDNV